MREVLVVIGLMSLLFVGAVCTPELMRQEVYGSSEEELSARTPNDFALIIDKSGSMRVGNRFSEAQSAAKNFINELSGSDRAGIIAFDSRAHVYTDFSANKNHLEQTIDRMTIGDWTQYHQGLTAARNMFETRSTGANHRRIYILMSDGRPDDNINELLTLVNEIVNSGSCIYTIAYADDALEEAQEVLGDIANRSQQATGCGQFFSAREDSFDLQRTYQTIYAQVASEQTLSVDVRTDTIDDVRFLLDITSTATGQQLSACFAPEKRVVITQNRRAIRDITTRDNTVVFDDMFPGEYDYFVFARETCDGTCLLTGQAEGSFLVETSSRACTPPWDELSVLLSRNDYTEVHITSSGFIPQSIRTDGVVIWKNLDEVPRQVVSTTGSFQSPVLEPGEEWQYIFPPGSHGYREASGTFSGVLRQENVQSSTPVDIVLVIDNSGSMAGSAMENAREAAKNFVGVLGPQDRVALVVFDHRATLVQQLTSDKSRTSAAIDSIVPQGGTLYIPALRAAAQAIRHSSSSRDQAVIFLSDGIPHDLEGVPGILRVIEQDLPDVCLFTIGYAEEGIEAIETLNTMGQFSSSITGCGSFFYASNDKEELGRVLGEVYAQTQEPRLEVFDLAIDDQGSGEFVLSAKVRSQENGARLPSESAFGCIPVATVRAVFGNKEFPMRFDGEQYVGRVELPAGRHVGYVTARLSAFDSPAQATFGFSRAEVVVPRGTQWYLWLLLSLGIVAIAYLFMHRPTRH